MYSICANNDRDLLEEKWSNIFNVLDFDKIELEQQIELKCDFADPRLSQIREFKLKASSETFKAFLAFSRDFD